MSYANRTAEFEQMKYHINSEDTPVIIIKAYPACGISSFINERIKGELIAPELFLYLPIPRENSLKDVIFSQLVNPPFDSIFQKFLDKTFGSHNTSVISSIAQGVPYIGSFLGRIAESKSAPPIYTGDYPSAVEQLLLPFFSMLKEKAGGTPFTIVLDPIGRLSEDSFSLLHNLIDSGVLQCIIIQIQGHEEQFLKFRNSLRLHSINFKEVEFDRPHTKLIKELAALYNLHIEDRDADMIANNSNQNIHKIIDAILDYGNHSIKPDEPLSECEKTVISILHIFSIPMDEKELINVVASGNDFAMNIMQTCHKAFQSLVSRGLITWKEGKLELCTTSHPVVQKILDSYADQLVYKNIVYSYLCVSNNNSRLRYLLSQQLGCTSRKDALPFLQSLIKVGEIASPELLSAAELKRGNREDCLLACINYCRMRRYKDALQWISSIIYDETDEGLNALRATLLNRTRNTALAEKELIRCLRKQGEPSRQNLLGSFLISNYIHAENMPMAQKVFVELIKHYPNSPMQGYLYRNVASAYNGNRDEWYEKALEAFTRDNDDFGLYTTLCNWGYAQCLEKKYEEALQKLQKAQDGLMPFSKTHLHIVYNNLGICYLMLEKYQEASQNLLLAKTLGENSMPKIFTSINMACLNAVSGNTSKAVNLLRDLEAEIEEHPLDRVRQKYYINRLLVECLSGNKNIDGLIAQTEKYLDRYHPEQTEEALQVYQSFSKSPYLFDKQLWRKLYSPCGLAYWYMDPLKLLPKGTVK